MMSDLTNEQIREILNDAPNETNYVTDVALKRSQPFQVFYHLRSAGHPMKNYGTDWFIVSIKYLHEILTLREHIVELERELKENDNY